MFSGYVHVEAILRPVEDRDVAPKSDSQMNVICESFLSHGFALAGELELLVIAAHDGIG
jgi:hypothetical protein